MADRRGYCNGYRLSRMKSPECAIESTVLQFTDVGPHIRLKIPEVLRERT